MSSGLLWWALEDSNFWPSPCKGDALPTELNARTPYLIFIHQLVERLYSRTVRLRQLFVFYILTRRLTGATELNALKLSAWIILE